MDLRAAAHRQVLATQIPAGLKYSTTGGGGGDDGGGGSGDPGGGGGFGGGGSLRSLAPMLLPIFLLSARDAPNGWRAQARIVLAKLTLGTHEPGEAW